MILSNKSETAVFVGIVPTDYGIKAELGVFLPNAPSSFDLYVVPIEETDKPIGTFEFTNRTKGWEQSVVDIPLKKLILEES